MKKFYFCRNCGNLFVILEDSRALPICCEENMHLLVPKTAEMASEKHVPVIVKDDGDMCAETICHIHLQVGDVKHPMLEDHYIKWILLETDKGIYKKCLKANDEPSADFYIAHDEQLCATYAFCNLHGLWKNEIAETCQDHMSPGSSVN